MGLLIQFIILNCLYKKNCILASCFQSLVEIDEESNNGSSYYTSNRNDIKFFALASDDDDQTTQNDNLADSPL